MGPPARGPGRPVSARPLVWVLGAGGLLGSSVVRLSRARGDRVWAPATPIDWRDPGAADRIRGETAAFLAATGGAPWRVYWCAGAAVVGSSPADLATERVSFEALLSGLGSAPDPEAGALFVASTAGGLYAGSAGAPYDERTPPRPISPYGEAKLAQEHASARLGLKVLHGRLSNLYGPRQNLEKPQGLISQVARSHILHQPISIYVPLDTMRDYLYADDAARLVVDGMDRLVSRDERVVEKVMASQQSVTIGFLVSEFRRMTRRAPRVVYGASPAAAYQVRDLRLRSRVWADLDANPVVPLPVGIHAVLSATLAALGRGTLR